MNTSFEYQQSASLVLAEDAFHRLGINHAVQKVEGTINKALQWFDCYSGIDWLAKDEDDHIYGIASRIRHITTRCKEAYPEFTIRYKTPSGNRTEYAKRLEAIDRGYICPAITTQTWYSGSTFICGATIPTKELYNFVEMNEYRLQVQTAPDGKQFLCVPWDALRKANLNVTVVTGSISK
jgi:hypothetical protein